ncbi:sulfite exporter TauE/SafE family protein 4-like isoform X2 [Juglans microcarpa x Juglans regia]|uniref:sulfite exporter TauE/SafE family protein 4-like isoform X2 n=1 Tax=Juglans microcarpa x Juglans regia TaxID=2249226 RepID=UPI001B7DE971|nr:sulfite exporter TauE/SafE family protein 4-like isoform X2 [Juglans microcarpa x Juglans regia]
MATSGFVLFLLTGFSVAVLSVLFVSHPANSQNSNQNGLSSSSSTLSHSAYGSITETVWPKLEFSWRLVLATVIGFLGSACGTVGGVGGGGIFVPMLTLIVGFDTKSAAALSKWTSSRSFFKGIQMWKEETVLKKEMTNRQGAHVVNSRGELLIDTEYEPLLPREEKTQMQIVCFNLRWKRTLVLLLVWVFFLVLQIIKNDVEACSAWYWVLFCLQFPIALVVFGYESVKLYIEHKKRVRMGNTESICEASIGWTATHIAFCSLCGILGGIVGGLLGSGGGFILGPLLLEIGVIPQVASATATFVMTFSSSLSVVEFYLLNRFPIPYALYLTSVSILAGFWGQFLVRKLITFLGRASIIVFILSGVIFLSALTMGVVGIETSIKMIRNHEFMGFLGFCSSQ